MKAQNRILWVVAVILLPGASVLQAAELISNQVEQPPDLLAAPGSNRGLFRLAMFEIIPQIGGGVMYDNNIYTTSDNKVDDFIWNITPGLTAVAVDSESGKTISLSYIPSFRLYTENTENNYVAQSASLGATLPFSKLTLGMGGSFTSQQYSQVGAGQLINSENYQAQLTSRYEAGAKTSVEVNALANGQTGEGLIANHTFGNINWVNYQNSEKLTVGLGAGFNFMTVENAPDQTFQQALARGDYRVSEKLILNVIAGAEFRQYDTDVSSTIRPILTLGASYRATEKTSFNLTGYGRTASSTDQTNQNFYATGFTLNAVQRFTEKVSVTAYGGYEYNRYFSTLQGVGANGPTDLITLGAMFNYQIRERWTAGVYYFYRRNSGNQSINSFNANQAGIQTSWTY